MPPLLPLFWTYGDVSSVFQSQSGQPYSHFGGGHIDCMSLKFTSGVTHADPLVASMVAELFPLCTCIGGSKNQNPLCRRLQYETRQANQRSTDWAMPAGHWSHELLTYCTIVQFIRIHEELFHPICKQIRNHCQTHFQVRILLFQPEEHPSE